MTAPEALRDLLSRHQPVRYEVLGFGCTCREWPSGGIDFADWLAHFLAVRSPDARPGLLTVRRNGQARDYTVRPGEHATVVIADYPEEGVVVSIDVAPGEDR